MANNTAKSPSRVYRCARWLYQPAKLARASVRALLAERHARQAAQQYVQRDGFKGLQIGCGPHRVDGWLNGDLLNNPKRDVYVDITRPLPVPDHSLDAIYAGEVIEHVSEPAARAFFADARRALQPTGTLRVTTPDLTEICRLFLGVHPEATIEQFGSVWRREGFTPERWVNGQFRHHGHQFLWSYELLSSALREAGFRHVGRCGPRQSDSGLPQLSKLELHYGDDLPRWVFARTLIVEAAPEPRPQQRSAESRVEDRVEVSFGPAVESASRQEAQSSQ